MCHMVDILAKIIYCFIQIKYLIRQTHNVVLYFNKNTNTTILYFIFCNKIKYNYVWRSVYFIFYVVRTFHYGMKLYNDQRKAQMFNLFIYLLLPYIFRAFFFSPSSDAGVQLRQLLKSLGYGVSARALALDSFNHDDCLRELWHIKCTDASKLLDPMIRVSDTCETSVFLYRTTLRHNHLSSF
jgi:hypothetical protein